MRGRIKFRHWLQGPTAAGASRTRAPEPKEGWISWIPCEGRLATCEYKGVLARECQEPYDAFSRNVRNIAKAGFHRDPDSKGAWMRDPYIARELGLI